MEVWALKLTARPMTPQRFDREVRRCGGPRRDHEAIVKGENIPIKVRVVQGLHQRTQSIDLDIKVSEDAQEISHPYDEEDVHETARVDFRRQRSGSSPGCAGR